MTLDIYNFDGTELLIETEQQEVKVEESVFRTLRLVTPNLTHLKLEKTSLESFSGFTLPNLVRLSIKGRRLDTFKNNHFPNLVRLKITENKLEEFTDVSFPKLEKLDLYSNSIRSFKNNDLPNLKWLILDENRLGAFESPEGSSSLERLELADNNLISFQGNYPRLIFLQVENNSLTKIDACLPVIRVLYSGSNSISEIPEFKTLVKLYMANNLLTFVCNTSFPGLEILDLEKNKIVSFDSNYLPQVRELILSGNPINHFKAELFRIRKFVGWEIP